MKKIVGGTESEYVLAGPNGYDGYQVQLDPDGTYSIQTPCESGRLVTAKKGEQTLLCSEGADGVQKWIIKGK